jgi:DNA-directed RNA polymerase specialized sigma24 family protein
MKRKDFYLAVQPLTEKLYRFAYTLIPDDLQAEQLVIDGVNAYLLKERKNLLKKDLDLNNKKEILLFRRATFKGILRYMCDIGIRRSTQLNEQMKLGRPEEYAAFYTLDPKVRVVFGLRYDSQFTVEEIEEILHIPRYEVIEKIHNGRFLLLNDLNQGMTL